MFCVIKRGDKSMGWKQYLSIRLKNFHPVCQRCQVLSVRC
ncbi:Uncharacterized protein dnm_059260 [Desulfonema magnum]|uniref:Uncharacterized protein n=1 Tax=Desulfonema magnum TaxID=45655 RepID=A0A975BQ91_9BACT|nr:Uncharacterized protein dnm_059260 [Desulfonema magnum]